MNKVKLEVAYRNDMSKSRIKSIRKQGGATGSICGHNFEPVSVEVDLAKLVKQVKAAGGSMHSLFELDVTGAPKDSSGNVIIKNHSRDPISKRILDIQFQRVSMNEKVHVGVAIELTGKAEGGTIEQTLTELQVMSLPSEIIPKLVVDISSLLPGHHISVADLNLPEGTEVLTPADATVVTLKAPTVSVTETVEEETAPEE